MVLNNKRKKTLKKGGVRRSTRERRLSDTAREIQNARKKNEYIKQQKKIRTLQRQEKKAAEKLRRDNIRINMQKSIGSEEMQNAAASAIAAETNPDRKTGQLQKNFFIAVGTQCAARSRSEVKVPAPPYQLKYAIEVAKTIVNNEFLRDIAERDDIVSLIIKISERLLRHTRGEWSGKGKVPNTWVCWLCGTPNIFTHEAEHVIPQFEMTFDQGIFSRQGEKFAGLSKEDAIKFINSIEDISILSTQETRRTLLTVGLLIAEMVPSDRCCNQVKLDALFTSINENGIRSPSSDNILNYLDTLWEKVFNAPEYTHCGDTDRNKISVYKTKENFIKERYPRIIEFVEDICYILNSPALYPDIDKNLLRVINCASAMITKPTTYEDTAFAAGTDYVPDAVAFQSADNVTSQVPPSPSQVPPSPSQVTPSPSQVTPSPSQVTPSPLQTRYDYDYIPPSPGGMEAAEILERFGSILPKGGAKRKTIKQRTKKSKTKKSKIRKRKIKKRRTNKTKK